MDKLRELQINYLKRIMREKNIMSMTALARQINVSPSTFNRFITENDEEKPGSQKHLSALTLDALHTFSGITPPTTKVLNFDKGISSESLKEAIKASIQFYEKYHSKYNIPADALAEITQAAYDEILLENIEPTSNVIYLSMVHKFKGASA